MKTPFNSSYKNYIKNYVHFICLFCLIDLFIYSFEFNSIKPDINKNQTINKIQPIEIQIPAHFMLTHKGMHSYNGNLAAVVVSGKGKKKVQISLKKQLAAKKIRKRQIRKKITAPKIVPKVRRMFKSPINNINMREYIALVCNPIHNTRAIQIPNFDAKPSYPFADYTEKGNGLSLYVDWDDGTTPVDLRGILFVFRYGPGELTIDQNNLAWGTYAIPVQDNGTAIHYTGTTWPVLRPTLHDEIWQLTNAIRLVSYGMRVKSNIEIVTDTSAQYVARYYASQILQGDFETWAGQNETSIVDYLAASPVFETFSNAQGASARWNPCQDVDALLRYYPISNLIGSTDTGPLSTHGYYYPCIYVEFAQLISAVPIASKPKHISTIGIKHEKELQIAKEREQVHKMMERLALSEIKDNDDDDIKSLSSKLSYKTDTNKYKNINVSAQNFVDINVSKRINNVRAEQTLTYAIPLYMEFRYFLEGTLIEPSPLIGTVLPIDKDFYHHYAWLATETNKQTSQSLCPLVSDGFSFKNVAKALKMINPHNVRRGFQWAGGMARAMNDGVGDLMNIWQGSIFNSNNPNRFGYRRANRQYYYPNYYNQRAIGYY